MKTKNNKSLKAKAFWLLTAVMMVFGYTVTAVTVTTFLSPCAYAAQEISGSIRGTVKDQNGAVIAGASVTASNEQRTYSTTSDSNGTYTFAALPPGTYKISVESSGFSKYEIDKIQLELGRTLQVNIDLKVGNTSEIINVSASDEPIVDLTSSKTSVSITDRQIQVLPKGLNFSSVLLVAPGTRPEGKNAGFQIDGSSGAENTFVVDGVEVTRIRDGQLGSSKNIPLEFVKEVQVKSGGYEAEFGGATGGVVNVVTKSGSNEYHGEVRLEYTSDSLRGEDNPTLRINPLDPKQQTFEYFKTPTGKDATRFYSPVFSLGGPIIKDRFWFYGAHAPQYNRINRRLDLIKAIAPGDTSIVTLDSRLLEQQIVNNYSFLRLDVAPTSKLSGYANFTQSAVRTRGNLVGYQTASSFTFSNPRYGFQGGYTPSWQFSSGVNWNVSPNLILSFRGGHTYLNDKGGSYDIPENTPRIAIVAPCSGPQCAPGTTVTGNATIISNNRITFDITRRTNLNFDATYIANIGGQQHIFKGGYQRNQLSNKVLSGRSGGEFFFFFNRSFAGQRGAAGYYLVQQFGTVGDVSSSNQGFFIQDTWRAHRNLTLNLGLRMEKEFLPAFPIDPTFHPTIDPNAQVSTKPIDFGYGDKLAPRIGGAWDVLGNGKLKVAASFSVFFDTMKYELARGSFGGDFFLRTYRKLEQFDFRGINLANQPGAIIQGPIDFRVPSNVTDPGARPGIDPDLKPFKMREFSSSVDYSITNDYVFSFRFTRKDVLRTIEDVGGLDAAGNEIYTIGNPGFGTTVTDFTPATPKAVREYTGFEFRFDKRFSNNWYANVQYVYSKLFGNYSGLASSDENGRSSPNVNRFFDLPELVYNAYGQQVLGRLATDRANTFKAFGAYRFNYNLFGKGMNTEIGGTQLIYQGTPISSVLAEHVGPGGADILPEGRGDLGRTPVFTQTDLVLTHFINLNERVKLKLSFNVFNLFDERNVTDIFPNILAPGQFVQYGKPSDDFPTAFKDFLNSNGDYNQRIQNQKLIRDPRYKQPSAFQTPREARFAIGVTF